MNPTDSFDFMMPTRIVFGAGRTDEVGSLAGEFGKRAMLVTYKDTRGVEETIEKVRACLNQAGISVEMYSEVEPDPPTEIINRGAEIVREEGIEVMVGLGGGSALDSAKAIGVVAVNGGDAWDYMSCNPERREFSSAMPVIAIPTTAGTGSETTAVAVLTSKKAKTKGSIVHPSIFARVAIVDPELSKSMPPKLTASTGVDALGHAMESFISKKMTPFVEYIAPKAVKLIWENLPIAFEDGDNMTARANMAWASTLAGMTLAQSGAIGVHCVAQALGAYLHIPHGLGVAVATPYFLEYNRAEAKDKYIKLAGELGIGAGMKKEGDIADKFIEQMKDFLKKLGIPEKLGKPSGTFDMTGLVDNCLTNAPLSLANNPRSLNAESMAEIVSKILT